MHSFGLSREQFAAVAFEDELLGFRDDQARSPPSSGPTRSDASSVMRHGCDPVAVAAAFAALGWSIDQDVLALVERVRDAGRARVALFSNASTRLEADLESAG